MTRKIFDIKLKMPAGIKPPPAGQADGFAAAGAEALTLAVGEAVLERVKYALSKGGKFQVGATGMAEENVFLQQVSGGKLPEVEIFEGELTKANYFIRRGSVGGGTPPPVGAIKEWLIAKRIPVFLPDVHVAHRETGAFKTAVPNMPSTPSQQVRYTRSGRPWAASADLFEEVAYRIAWSIAFAGTSKFSMGRPPIGARYFDYPKWVVDQRYRYTQILRQGSEGLARALMKFALSGKREEGLDPALRELFRYRRMR